MWQRIQTLYLLISAALLAALCFSTAYTVSDPDGVYKSRILQMRLAVLSAIVALGMQCWLAWMYFSFEGPVFSWTVIFPLIVFICNMLAARGCYQDQLVVESAYRVRERRAHRKKK